jgi:hypothetical protein
MSADAKPLRIGSVRAGTKPEHYDVARTDGGVMGKGPAFLFDLDGTLVDSVYQHVLAWQDALDRMGFELAVWRIHRKIGMSGGLFANALLRETGRRSRRRRPSGSASCTVRHTRPGSNAFGRCPVPASCSNT